MTVIAMTINKKTPFFHIGQQFFGKDIRGKEINA